MHHASTVLRHITTPCLRAPSSSRALNPNLFPCLYDAWAWPTHSFTPTFSRRACFTPAKTQAPWLCESFGRLIAKSHRPNADNHISDLTLVSPSSSLGQSSFGKIASDRRNYSADTQQFGRLSESEYRRHPSKFRHLSSGGIERALGPEVSRKLGNKVLETLQKQRITGTLDQSITHDGVDANLIGKGLVWLRANYPVNEDAAIIKRIEYEERQLESQFVADAERFKIYKPQESAKREGIYGKSQLDAMRKEKMGPQKQTDEIRNAAPDTANIQHATGRAVLARRTESAEWVQRYKEKAALSELLEPEKISKTKRLLPSAIFMAVVIGLSAVFACNYRPPERKARIWPDMPPAAATALVLVGLNVAAFFMWRIPFLWRFMNQNFLLIPATPRVLSLLGNTFSHHSPTHLAVNMAFLWFVGTKFHDQVGRGNFLALYLSCGVFASFVSLSRFVLVNSLLHTSLGASGAMAGIIAAWLAVNSSKDFTIALVPEAVAPKFSARFALASLLAMEMYGAYRGRTKIDHWAHLGGYAAGISGAEVLKYRRRGRMRADSTQGRRSGW